MGGEPADDGRLTGVAPRLIDTHIHIWDVEDPGTEWLRDQSELPMRVGIAELLVAMSRDLDGMVLVEGAASTVATHKLMAAARSLPWAARVVGWLDLNLPDVRRRLGELVDADGSGVVAGVRAKLTAESDPVKLDAALDALTERGLVAELLLGRRQLPLMVDLIRRHPSLTVVVDHLAALADVGADTAPWLRAIDELAGLPNAVIKLSGWRAVRPERVRWATERLGERVGCERLMFGSDWPLSARFGSHDETVAATRELAVQSLQGAQLDEVFGGVARRVYGFPAGADLLRESER